MAYFLFKCWHEKLFSVNRENVISQKAKLPIFFREITLDNIELVEDLRGKQYVEQFRKQLSMGDFGYYAYWGEKVVAYGWVKHQGSQDYFFKFTNDICYLCRFFTHESVRGNGIYPAIITALIEHEKSCKKFYIDVERGNESSEKGLKKVGFNLVKEYGFIRGFKKTFNMKTLK